MDFLDSAAGEMRNSRVKAVLILLSLTLFTLIGSGASAQKYPGSSYVLRNLTVGYLTAAKGNLADRQGLAISGALTLALKEVNKYKVLPVN